MLNKESQHQTLLKQYPQRHIYKRNSYKQFFRVTKKGQTSYNGDIDTKHGKLSLNGHSDPIINKVNGHQIKDLQKSTICNCLDLKKSFSVAIKNAQNPEETTDSNCNCSRRLYLNGTIEKNSSAKKDDIYENSLQLLTNGETDHNHRKKKARLKESPSANNEGMIYVCRASQRLSFLRSSKTFSTPSNTMIIEKLLQLQDSLIDIKVHRKQVVQCQSKSMRSSPTLKTVINNESCSNKNEIEFKSVNSNTVDSTSLFSCEWHDCYGSFHTSESLSRHVKTVHIAPTSDNDVFVCLWRGCKFNNQPSCSYKWLSKHVAGHCDVKPFKCVIFGCDMTFVTQNGLARHVPTHFNESRVRRACVITNESKRDTSKPKRSQNASPIPCSTPNNEINEEERQNPVISRLQSSVDHDVRSRRFSSETYNAIKNKLQHGTCQPLTNSGYLDKLFRIEHKVIGRRKNIDGTDDMLLTPSLNNLFPNGSYWCDAKEFRKRKHTHVDLPVKDISEDIRNRLYDMEHKSRRRKKLK